MTLPARATLLAPGVLMLLAAFVLSLLVSISLPSFSAMDISRTHFDTQFLDDSGDDTVRGVHLLGELRVRLSVIGWSGGCVLMRGWISLGYGTFCFHLC